MYSGMFSTDKRFVWKKTPIWNWDREFKKKNSDSKEHFSPSCILQYKVEKWKWDLQTKCKFKILHVCSKKTILKVLHSADPPLLSSVGSRRSRSHWGAVLFQCWGHAVKHGEEEQEQHVCFTCDVQHVFSHQSTAWQTTCSCARSFFPSCHPDSVLHLSRHLWL